MKDQPNFSRMLPQEVTANVPESLETPESLKDKGTFAEGLAFGLNHGMFTVGFDNAWSAVSNKGKFVYGETILGRDKGSSAFLAGVTITCPSVLAKRENTLGESVIVIVEADEPTIEVWQIDDAVEYRR